jgi:hypothetical protein
MKTATGILALILPVTVSAQNFPGPGGSGMSASDMQNMMQQAQQMQTCMQGVDQSRIEAFEQRARTVEAEVKSLCGSGKRDAAQQEAFAFAQDISNDPDVRTIIKCGEMMSGMLPKLPFTDQVNESDPSVVHVCDQ